MLKIMLLLKNIPFYATAYSLYEINFNILWIPQFHISL